MTKHIEIKENFTGSSQLFIKDQFLETIKVKGTFSDDEYKNSLRVYCSMMGSKGNTAFNVQLRSFGNLHHSHDKSVAKPFQTVSTIGLTIKDVEEILAFMKREEGRYGQFEEVDGNQQWVGRYEKNPHKDFHNKNVIVTEQVGNDFKSSSQITQKFVDQKLREIQDNLELEDCDGEPITINFKECSVSYVIDILEQTIDNINFRRSSVNDHQIKCLKILKEIKKSGLNYSCCSHQNTYDVVEYER